MASGAIATATGPPLVGREEEQQVIGDVLAAGRAGRGGALGLRGPAGIGKTALLEWATHHALDHQPAQVVRAAGVPAEHDLPYATLQWLLRPLRDRIGALPRGDATVLEAVVGTGAEVPDPATAGSAILDLISVAAADRPVTVVVDDVQWVDRPSAEALTYAARRLGSEPAVMLLAARDESPEPTLAGITTLGLTGLDEAAAIQLLAEAFPDLVPGVRDAVVREARGYPAALAELPATIDPMRRRGAGGLVIPFGVQPAAAPTIEELESVVRGLPPTAQALVTVAAAAVGDGGLGVVLPAAERFGASLDDMLALEGRGLARAEDNSVRFLHPLARVAAYRAAPITTRIEVHRALAEVLDRLGHRARVGFHRAVSVTGPDGATAAELARAAADAIANGYHVIAAGSYERAALAAADPRDRGRHLVAAAEQCVLAGLPQQAVERAEQARQATGDREVHRRASLVVTAVRSRPGDHRARHRSYLEAARAAAVDDPAAAGALARAAAEQAWYVGDWALADAAAEPLAGLDDHPEVAEARALAAAVSRLVRRDGTGLQALRAHLDAHPGGHCRGGPIGEDLILLTGRHAVPAGADGGPPACFELLPARRPLPAARHQAALGALVSGRFPEARAQASAAIEGLAHVTGTSEPPACCLWHQADRAHWSSRLRGIQGWLAAVAGDEASCRSFVDEAFAHVATAQPGPATAVAIWALAVLDLAAGGDEAAAARLADLADGPAGHLVVTHHALPDLVEAAVHAGRPDLAREHLGRLADLARHSAQPWVAAAAARSRALVGPADETEGHFRAALEVLVRGEQPYELARTRLAYGEWLRRAARRRDAQPHLQAAMDAFDQMGARRWGDRAERELRAAGYTSRRRTAEGPGDQARSARLASLTPRELQVVELAATGASNREIAARLYMSPRTVGYHLHKAFPKLQVTSRHELGALFPS